MGDSRASASSGLLRPSVTGITLRRRLCFNKSADMLIDKPRGDLTPFDFVATKQLSEKTDICRRTVNPKLR
ncbi:MAG: hypothetical protein ABGW90_10665, partial [Martelella sp.]